MSGDPVGTIPVRRDPNPTGTNGRRRIDDRGRNGNDRRNNTEDDRWTPAAATPAIMPSGMPTPAPMVPPRRRRRRYQHGHGKRGDCTGANGNPHTRRDFLHGNCSYQTQQRAGCTPPYGPTEPGRQAHPAKVQIKQMPTNTAGNRRHANLIITSSTIAVRSARVPVGRDHARQGNAAGKAVHERSPLSARSTSELRNCAGRLPPR